MIWIVSYKGCTADENKDLGKTLLIGHDHCGWGKGRKSKRIKTCCTTT